MGASKAPAMSVFTSFLENSSIQGLGFIAQTRAFARVFWVIVVICCFTLASFLIMQNFQNWADSPVTTTMETLSIAEAPFPRVTVCPPKNTFTNLNYDILFASNMSMSTEKRDSFLKTLFSKAFDFEYDEAQKLYIQEENEFEFRNWYDGLTVNCHPFEDNPKLQCWPDKKQRATTHALSGSMSTPSFSQKFDISAFQNPPRSWWGHHREVEYNIELDIGMLSNDNRQFYFNIKIDADILEGMEKVLVCDKEIKIPWVKNISIDSNCTRPLKKCVSCPWPTTKTDKFVVTF